MAEFEEKTENQKIRTVKICDRCGKIAIAKEDIVRIYFVGGAGGEEIDLCKSCLILYMQWSN